MARSRELRRARASAEFTVFDGNLAGEDIPDPTQHRLSPTALEEWTRARRRTSSTGSSGWGRWRSRRRSSGSRRWSEATCCTRCGTAGPRCARARAGPRAWRRRGRRTVEGGSKRSPRRRAARPSSGESQASDCCGPRTGECSARPRDLAHPGRRAARQTRRGRPGRCGALVRSRPDAPGHDRSRRRPCSCGCADSIDRIDRRRDGGLVVTDYKTGKADRYKANSRQTRRERGQRLQLPLYALAARDAYGEPETAVRAEYWFTSLRGNFVRLGYDVTEDVLEQTRESLSVIVDGIRDGMFLARPRRTRAASRTTAPGATPGPTTPPVPGSARPRRRPRCAPCSTARRTRDPSRRRGA